MAQPLMDSATPAYERQPGESKRAHQAFIDYCMMGTARSLRKLHEIYVKQVTVARQADPDTGEITPSPPTSELSTLFTWSSRHHWQERIDAWDEEQKRLRRVEHLNAIREMVARHIQQDKLFLQHLSLPALELLKRLQDEPDVLKGFKVEDLLDLIVSAARYLPNIQKAERLAMGEPTEIAELWTAEDKVLLEKYRGLLEEIGALGMLSGSEGSDDVTAEP